MMSSRWQFLPGDYKTMTITWRNDIIRSRFRSTQQFCNTDQPFLQRWEAWWRKVTVWERFQFMAMSRLWPCMTPNYICPVVIWLVRAMSAPLVREYASIVKGACRPFFSSVFFSLEFHVQIVDIHHHSKSSFLLSSWDSFAIKCEFCVSELSAYSPTQWCINSTSLHLRWFFFFQVSLFFIPLLLYISQANVVYAGWGGVQGYF